MIRKSKLRKKRLSKRTILERAHKACWKAAVGAIKRRDKVCQVHKEACTCKVLVVDHFLSRTHKAVFYDERNLSLVCRDSNWEKFRGRKDTAYRIAKVVEAKWGQEAIDDMARQARFPKKWQVSELEEMTKRFDEMYIDTKEMRLERD